jgi:uncharacterized protein YodC (DUF2158 family)
MPMAFKVGQTVKQVVPVIEGPIMSVAIVNNEVAYEVAWTDATGDHTRFFTEEQIALVAESNDAPAGDA